jgi:hypothetical protein
MLKMARYPVSLRFSDDLKWSEWLALDMQKRDGRTALPLGFLQAAKLYRRERLFLPIPPFESR